MCSDNIMYLLVLNDAEEVLESFETCSERSRRLESLRWLEDLLIKSEWQYMHLYALKYLIKRFEIFLCNCSLAKRYRTHICHFSIKHCCAIICKKKIRLQWKCANKVIRIELELGQNNYFVSWNIQTTSLLTNKRPTWCELLF